MRDAYNIERVRLLMMACVCIVVLESIALWQGMNGAMLATALGALTATAGWAWGRKR